MSKSTFFVALIDNVPAPIQSILAGHIIHWKGIPHLRSQSLAFSGPFVDLDIFQADNSEGTVRVLLPLGCVLTIVEMTKGSHPPDFLSSAQ